ncbi:MAG: hypothetical protein JW750_08315, partial [Anaerolineaceae bacterium]|nr:hypothetical protein [Anaerolineaceae bacterium]
MARQRQLMVFRIFFALAALIIAFSAGVSDVFAHEDAVETAASGDAAVTIYFFWGDGCPHCEKEWEFFRSWLPDHPEVRLMDYETWYVPENQDLFNEMAAAYGFKPQGVPTTFIGDQYFVGFNESIQQQIISTVQYYLDQGAYPDPMARLAPAVEEEPVVAETEEASNPLIKSNTELDIPLIGTVDLSDYSLFVSTLVIAVVDGFNPCSLWVLSMLIALSLHTGSRKKVLLIGAVFLTVTALVYAIFIAGLFSVMSIVSYVGWIQVVVSLVAITFALINIKDYFWYKEGVSLTIADEKKPGIFKKMRAVVNAADSFWGTIGATIVLAVGVSLVEFSCTAGLPMVWTSLLNTQGVTVVTFLLLLLVYMVIYQLDELIIFIPAVMTLKSSKFEEKQGRLLKLIGGVLMLCLAFVLLINPSWMNELKNTLMILLIALGLTGLIVLLHKGILPKMGVYIGSDFDAHRKRASKYG